MPLYQRRQLSRIMDSVKGAFKYSLIEVGQVGIRAPSFIPLGICLGCSHKVPQTESLNWNVLPHGSRDKKFKMEGLAGSAPSKSLWGTLSGLPHPAAAGSLAIFGDPCPAEASSLSLPLSPPGSPMSRAMSKRVLLVEAPVRWEEGPAPSRMTSS